MCLAQKKRGLWDVTGGFRLKPEGWKGGSIFVGRVITVSGTELCSLAFEELSPWLVDIFFELAMFLYCILILRVFPNSHCVCINRSPWQHGDTTPSTCRWFACWCLLPFFIAMFCYCQVEPVDINHQCTWVSGLVAHPGPRPARTSPSWTPWERWNARSCGSPQGEWLCTY